MADYYQDTDSGSDANDGTTWALAKLTIEGLLSVMSEGDRGWIQGATEDTVASTRTLTTGGTRSNPCILTGVIDGTTNEPPILVDLAVTLPKISCTGSSSDIDFSDSSVYMRLHITSSDKISGLTAFADVTIIEGKLTSFDDINGSIGGSLTLINSEVEVTSIQGQLLNGKFYMLGGVWTFTFAAHVVDEQGGGSDKVNYFTGVDFSGLGAVSFIEGMGDRQQVRVRNCTLPPTFTMFGTTPTGSATMEVISSSDTTSQAATSSIQDYMYEDAHGSIDLEQTVVRTDGANDNASGSFSYAMTPHANATREGSNANLTSPEMVVWLQEGSNTLTIHICNDGAGDYNEDEVWVEFYTPDAGDTAQHTQTFFPALGRLLDSSTPITDDTGSAWGGAVGNHQKLSITITSGFEGYGYARLHLAKRQATPDTLYLDPIIVVT